MARRTSELSFTALRLEGGLLPPAMLNAIAQQEASHQTEADYELEKGLKLKDELGRYWTIARNRWQDFEEQRQRQEIPRAERATAWLTALLERVFGFQLTACGEQALAERCFPISHTAFAGTVPVLLCGPQFDLDKGYPVFGQEGRKLSPQGLMQEYLNASEDCTWGIVSNGLRLRILRDNPSLVRPAFLEADLELIFEDEIYSDFVALWLVLHASRFAPREGQICWLEAWRQQALQTGDRILGQLRNGVTRAIEILANGMLQHPANESLRQALRSQTLNRQALFHELVWLIYRFLFLFAAEDRDLLFGPEASPAQRRIYQEGYSLDLLRQRVLIRGLYDRRYHDLWEGQKIVWQQLRNHDSPLGLPALGGLFADDTCPHLEGCKLDNASLLKAVAEIAYFQTDHNRTRVNYRDLNIEEWGSVYESLIQLHPNIETDCPQWQFRFIGESGSNRKSSGSHYTPDVLVQELIQSVLVPVLQERLSQAGNPEEALLGMKILDPACGSGHFLLAAVRLMGKELARVRTGEMLPEPEILRVAIRDVIQHCIYGVDLNPLAVDLCKVVLWLEGLSRGRSLNFLDHRIRCGNSLVGVLDLDCLKNGIPDGAYRTVMGDNKRIAAQMKRLNRKALNDIKQDQLFLELNITFERDRQEYESAWREVEIMKDDDLAAVRQKQAKYERSRSSVAWLRDRSACNLWTAAFLIPLTEQNVKLLPTSRILGNLLKENCAERVIVDLADELAEKYHFFHWPLEFPGVYKSGGFDCILGRPPREKIQVREGDSFDMTSDMPAEAKFIKTSGRYSYFEKKNTYCLFVEAGRGMMSSQGRLGLLPAEINFEIPQNPKLLSCMIRSMKSLIFIFLSKIKYCKTELDYSLLKKALIIPPESYSYADIDFIFSRIIKLKLIYNFSDKHSSIQKQHYESIRSNQIEFNSLLNAELDAYYAYLHNLNRDEVSYILDLTDVCSLDSSCKTFRTVQENGLNQFSKDQGQRLILETWDRIFS
jgi:hypothetical protein